MSRLNIPRLDGVESGMNCTGLAKLQWRLKPRLLRAAALLGNGMGGALHLVWYPQEGHWDLVIVGGGR
jgi:hypothetical protein